MPVRLTLCGLLGELSVNETAALMLQASTGAKVI